MAAILRSSRLDEPIAGLARALGGGRYWVVRALLPIQWPLVARSRLLGVQIRLVVDRRDATLVSLFWDRLDIDDLGEFDATTFRTFTSLVRRSSCLIDVGANRGIFSLVATAINPEIEVHAFEPEPRVFGWLEANVQANDVEINIYERALSDQGGVQPLYVPMQGWVSSASLWPGFRDEVSVVEVNTTTLDAFVRESNIERIDLIKIDTEATDDRVIAGGSEVIRRDRPFVICEVLRGRPVEERIGGLLQEIGYVAFHLGPRGLEQQEVPTGSYTYRNFLLVHRDRVADLDPSLFGTG